MNAVARGLPLAMGPPASGSAGGSCLSAQQRWGEQLAGQQWQQAKRRPPSEGVVSQDDGPMRGSAKHFGLDIQEGLRNN